MSVVSKRPLTITERIVNKKRHTIGYVINGAEITRPEAVKLARRGWINGVKVAKGSKGHYISGDNVNLYALPTRVGA